MCAHVPFFSCRQPKNQAIKEGLSDALFAEEPWYRTLFADYRRVPAAELPAGMAYGHEFGSVCINTPVYLAWLVGQCRRLGVEFKRASLGHIAEAPGLHHCHHKDHDEVIVVNATGLMACRLGGVADAAVQPARGQVVVVRNVSPAMYCVSSSADGPGEILYTMTRAAGGGTVLGGTYTKGGTAECGSVWDANPDPNVANRIMQRVATQFPHIAGHRGVAGLDVVRHGVGLRPVRAGGVRLEAERVAVGNNGDGDGDGDGGGGGLWVVHNYGHAGWGYQGSYGTAERVVELVGEILSSRQEQAKSKL